MIEAGVVVGPGGPIHWHLPPGPLISSLDALKEHLKRHSLLPEIEEVDERCSADIVREEGVRPIVSSTLKRLWLTSRWC
jgi:hypothetical protein